MLHVVYHATNAKRRMYQTCHAADLSTIINAERLSMFYKGQIFHNLSWRLQRHCASFGCTGIPFLHTTLDTLKILTCIRICVAVLQILPDVSVLKTAN
jgi:hypothetical protein